MLISSLRNFVLVILIALYLDNISGEEDTRRRGVVTTRKNADQRKTGRAFQPRHQPHRSYRISQSQQTPRRRPGRPPRTTTGAWTTTTRKSPAQQYKRMPLLSFPDYDDTPLLNFPDPHDEQLHKMYLGYDNYCRTEWKNNQKAKARLRKRKGKGGAEDVVHETETQNRRLRQALINNAITAEPVPEHNLVFGFKLLDQSVEIFQAMCPDPYVPVYFINNAIYAFKKLHYLTTFNRTEYLKPTQFRWISDILSSCAKDSTPIVYFPDKLCKETILGYLDRNGKKDWLCTRWQQEFNKRVYDPLLDLIWHIYNSVRGYCFKYFNDNYQMHHTFGMAMLDLYSTVIRQRWPFQIEGNQTDYEFWDMILGPNHEQYFRNIERCTTAAIKLNPKGVFLPRFMIPGSVRFDKAKGSF